MVTPIQSAPRGRVSINGQTFRHSPVNPCWRSLGQAVSSPIGDYSRYPWSAVNRKHARRVIPFLPTPTAIRRLGAANWAGGTVVQASCHSACAPTLRRVNAANCSHAGTCTVSVDLAGRNRYSTACTVPPQNTPPGRHLRCPRPADVKLRRGGQRGRAICGPVA